MTCSARSPGIAANILSERLKRLEPEGRLIARLYSERPPRAACQLTAEGAELAGALRLPVRSCSGAADHQDPVMTSYLPLTCLAATLARCGHPGLARQPARVPVPRFAPRQRRVLLPYKSAHTGSWFAAYDTLLCPAADIPERAGLDNHRNPVMASHHPGGEPRYAVVDTPEGRSR